MPKQSLTRAFAGPDRAAFERHNHLTRGPVTQAEHSSLIKARATPDLEPHLTPGGTLEHSVNRKAEADREARIGFINKRLSRQKHRARDGFNRNQ